MKVQGFKRIVREDFPEEQQDLADKLGFSINAFADDIINLVNNNITIDDNLNWQVKEVDIVVDASGIPVNSVQFKSTLKGRCKGCQVTRADNLTNTNTYPTSAPFVSFTDNNGVIIINHVSGLQANQKYRLRLETRT